MTKPTVTFCNFENRPNIVD